jgi:hypothetical protein
VGLLDRLDAIDRRLRLGPASRRGRRGGPLTLLAMVALVALEYDGLVTTVAHDHKSGVPAVLAVFGMIVALMVVIVAIGTPRPAALRGLLLVQGVIAVRVLYRGLAEGPATRLWGLAVVAAFLALLLAPPSRRFYARGQTAAHSS